MRRNQARSKHSIRLQERDGEFLTLLFEQRALTRNQVLDLGLFKSVARCNARLKLLRDARLVKRIPDPLGFLGGIGIYALTKRGLSHFLSTLSEEARERFIHAPARVTENCLKHSLKITDVRIGMQRASSARQFDIEIWLSEHLARHKFAPDDTRPERVLMKPDAFVRFQTLNGDTRTLFIEVDLGNVSLPRMLERFKAYDAYQHSEAYQEIEAYQDATLELAVFTTGSKRLERLKLLAKRVPGVEIHVVSLCDLPRALSEILNVSLAGRQS